MLGFCAAALMSTAMLGSAAEAAPYRQGDANRDGSPDAADAVLLLQYAAGVDALPQEDIVRLDMNFDGAVDTADAVLLLQKAAEIWSPREWLASSEAAALPDGGNVLSAGERQAFRVYDAPVQRGLYVARSMDELKSIWAQFGRVCIAADGGEYRDATITDAAITDDDFATQDILVMVRVVGGTNTARRLEQVTRAGDCLVIRDTTVFPENPTPDLQVCMVLIGVDKADMQGIRHFALDVREQR